MWKIYGIPNNIVKFKTENVKCRKTFCFIFIATLENTQNFLYSENFLFILKCWSRTNFGLKGKQPNIIKAIKFDILKSVESEKRIRYQYARMPNKNRP